MMYSFAHKSIRDQISLDGLYSCTEAHDQFRLASQWRLMFQSLEHRLRLVSPRLRTASKSPLWFEHCSFVSGPTHAGATLGSYSSSQRYTGEIMIYMDKVRRTYMSCKYVIQRGKVHVALFSVGKLSDVQEFSAWRVSFQFNNNYYISFVSRIGPHFFFSESSIRLEWRQYETCSSLTRLGVPGIPNSNKSIRNNVLVERVFFFFLQNIPTV